MKIRFILIMSLILVLFCISCEKESSINKSNGKVLFSPNILLSSQLKAAKVSTPANIIITVKSSGNTVIDAKKLSLVKINGEYLTEPLQLEIGNYDLTMFAVLDASDNVIYAAPVSGTPSASLVTKPLSISFSIQKDIVTKLNPEVIPADLSNISDFGFVNYTPNIVPILNIATYSYDQLTNSLSFTNATLTISNGATTLGTWVLDPKNNQIIVDITQTSYTVKVEKLNFITYSETLTNEQFKSKLNSPFVVILKPDLINGLIASYPFDGNANDASGNGNNGVVNGPVLTSDRFGVAGKAYLFDGINDYIDIAPNFFKNRNEGTFAVWAKFTNNINAQYIGIFANSADFDNYLSLLRYDSINQVISIYAHTPPVGANDGYVIGSTKIQQGVYYHFVMTCDGSKWNLYVNGKKETLTVKAGTNLGAWTNDITIDNFRIGGDPMPGFAKCNFYGVLDDIKIYNRALTDNEVFLLYNE